MQYAIIRTGGKQYKVSEGSVVDVDKIQAEKNNITEIKDVLLGVSDGKVTIGKPTVKDAVVKAKVIDQIKGDKIRVAKFKAKARYRKVTGFRPSLTRLEIREIKI